jgi:hypothetical protein
VKLKLGSKLQYIELQLETLIYFWQN